MIEKKKYVEADKKKLKHYVKYDKIDLGKGEEK